MNRLCWNYFAIGFVLLFLSSNALAGAWLETKTEYDSDGDGTIDLIFYQIYDTDGILTETRGDDDADGTIDYISYFLYNTDGYEEICKLDSDADGNIDQIMYFSSTDNGAVSITEYDNDADGTIDTNSYAKFNCLPLPTIMKNYEGTGAYDGNGALESISYYTYDNNCNESIWKYDEDADGNIDEITYSTYDSQCHLIEQKSDDDNDGNFESIITSTYNEKGLIIQMESINSYEYYGISQTSQYLSSYTYTYDIYGNVIKTETQSHSSVTFSGQTIESDSTYITYSTWEYFENADSASYESTCGCPDGADTAECSDDDSDTGTQNNTSSAKIIIPTIIQLLLQ
nr:hypothetical protein [uncultured Desulfobulbus sp.]